MLPPGWHSRGYLPHFDGGAISQFLTFRTAGSLPRSVIDAWRAELRCSPATEAALEVYRRAEAYLDEGHGPCPLVEPRLAGLVEDALLHFDGERYRLHAWVVMPNHVHMLVPPCETWRLAELAKSWKSWTARRANALLNQHVAFWQREYFDRYIRNGKHFRAVVSYIEQNPVKAGLCARPEDWVFASARRRPALQGDMITGSVCGGTAMTQLTRRELLGGLLLLGAAHRSVLTPAAGPSPQRPNVILMLIDDLGWTDLGCFGSDYYQTPNIDRLAAQGMKFTQAYSACTVCSPSRAALMTGKYPARLHLTDWIAGTNFPWAKLKPPEWRQYLPLEERTLAEALKPAGYATEHIGKWHLGGEAYYPDKQGFDRNIGGTFRGQPPRYFSPYGIETLPDGPPGEYLTDREGNEALKFMEANRQRPFFLYLAHHAVHDPVQAKEAIIDEYRVRTPGARHNKAPYAAMIDSVDESVGQILAKLRELGIDNRTIIVFTSDNGGLLANTSNSPLRAGKGSAYEGGVRVPLIVRWPGQVRAGSACDVPVIGADLYPTILAATGAKAEAGQVIDGESILPLWRQNGSLKRQAIFWHYPHNHPGGATPYSAIRAGNWKLIEFQEDGHAELYNIAEDIGEKDELSGRFPEKARELRARLHAWRQEVGAQMAVPNPNYDPAREGQTGAAAKRAQPDDD
jgi:arylsulfatase A